MNAATTSNQPIIVKKYANRRLYDTETSAYITLDDLCKRVKEGKDFIVQDAQNGADLTNQVLTQIILEQEIKGFHLLPTAFLRSVIRLYDDNMASTMQNYLNASMLNFASNQEQMKSLFGRTIGDYSPMNQFEEMTRQNVAMFEKTVQMFNPFGSMFQRAGQGEESEEKVVPVAKAKRAKRG
ncbi:MAG: polyhydroxyalkanoate synthesis repressor PhaR [Alphaproteobacteria bacterium]|nr:polyhydroxyalkanoate synthesis repressor PhaR [Alphaproteobacteria bacterium]